MIRSVEKKDLKECANVIQSAFMTVAEEFGFTKENAPGFTAFSITEERLTEHLEENRPMFVYWEEGQIRGYYSLQLQEDGECELNHLCVLAKYRHKNIGKMLLEHAFCEGRKLGCQQMNIGIVEENVKLRKWYEANGAEHLGTEKYDFFPFSCGFMRKKLS